MSALESPQKSLYVVSGDGAADTVDVADMSLSIEGRPVLRNISWRCCSSRMGVIGRNGSGKSTLARVLAGLVPVSSGAVLVNGKDLASDRRAALDEVGILFQNPDHQIIFPTVLEEVAFGIAQKGASRFQADALATDVLARFNVPHWADVHISRLSQGQKHLVCLMAVVAMSPRLLILDEPFAGLDMPTRSQLRRYLSHYRGSLLHISHDPADLAGYQQVLWLDGGAVRAAGATAQVLPAYLAEMENRGDEDDIFDLAD